MRILYLSNSYDETNGWGRYAAGFLHQGKMRLGEANVVAPDPLRLRSCLVSWKQLVLAPLDALKLLRQAKSVDGIHALTEPMTPLVFLLAWLSRKPFVISVAGTYGDMMSYPSSVRWLYRFAFRKAARLSVLSRYTASVVKRSVPDSRMTMVYGGFTPPPHAPSKTGMSGERRVLSVGAIKQRKGFHTLVEALRRLKTDGFEVRCDIVGPKYEGDSYVAMVEKAIVDGGLTGRVVMHGKVPQETLEHLYADCDLFVLPSEHSGTAFEGLGLVYLEAMSYGTPAIGCLQSGAEDVIEDSVNGRLVPPGDAAALASAIRTTLEDPARWARLSSATRPSIEKFRWDKVGADMEALQLEAFTKKR